MDFLREYVFHCVVVDGDLILLVETLVMMIIIIGDDGRCEYMVCLLDVLILSLDVLFAFVIVA